MESILQPSKEIAPQFVSWVVQRSDGRSATGMLIAEGVKGEQTYVGADGKPITLRKNSRKLGPVSASKPKLFKPKATKIPKSRYHKLVVRVFLPLNLKKRYTKLKSISPFIVSKTFLLKIARG